MNEYSITVVRAFSARFLAETQEEALSRALQRTKQGKYDKRFWEYHWGDRDPIVFAIPWEDEARHIAETLDALREAKAAHHDPNAGQQQKLRAARELASMAMRIIREEMAGAEDPEVIKSASSAFHAAKLFALAATKREVSET